MSDAASGTGSWQRMLLDLSGGGAALPADLSWAPLRPGVEIARIYGDGERGASAAFLRYAAGASVPLHEHPGLEHILVLEGSQSDEHGSYGAGSCLIHAPGSRHSVRSEEGCLVLALWAEPVVFV